MFYEPPCDARTWRLVRRTYRGSVLWLCWSCTHRRSFADDLPYVRVSCVPCAGTGIIPLGTTGTACCITATKADYCCTGYTYLVPGIPVSSTSNRTSSVDVIYYQYVPGIPYQDTPLICTMQKRQTHDRVAFIPTYQQLVPYLVLIVHLRYAL